MAWEEWSEYERGYVAAFIDGEGSICITKSADGYYRAVCALYNTHLPTMNFLSDLIGEECLTRSVDKRRRVLQTKDNYAIYIRRKLKLLDFLNFILPYLVTKVEQCKLTIKFLETVLNREESKYSEEDKIKMEQFYIQNSKLNKGD